jgi:peptide/nickel transport system permease protein
LPDLALASLLAWRKFHRHKLAMAGAIFLIFISLTAIFAHQIARYPYEKTGVGPVFQGPTSAHWFGTDAIGRDLYSRIIYGGRISLAVGFAVALVATFIGTCVGATAGYFGGKLDNFVMRVTDLFIALPLLVVLILLRNLPERQPWAKQVMGNAGSMRATIVILSLFFWMPTARIVRGVVLSLKEKEFVEAACIGLAERQEDHLPPPAPELGRPDHRHGDPQRRRAILTAESALSFLGFGVSPPVLTWSKPARRQQGLLRHRSVAGVVPGPHRGARGAGRETSWETVCGAGSPPTAGGVMSTTSADPVRHTPRGAARPAPSSRSKTSRDVQTEDEACLLRVRGVDLRCTRARCSAWWGSRARASR